MNPYFAIDPVKHKTGVTQQERLNHSKKCSKLLQTIFGKTQQEIFEASKSYINRHKDLLSFFFALSFWQGVTQNELSEKARTIPLLASIITSEAISPRSAGKFSPGKIKGQSIKRYRNSKPARFTRFMIECLSETDKRLLLKGYQFAKPGIFPLERRTTRHLVYNSLIRKNRHYAEKYCFSNINGTGASCCCINYIDSINIASLNKFLIKLSKNFYQMRCSIVHDAYPVGFCHLDTRPQDVASWGMTLVDTYQITGQGGSSLLVQYESEFHRDQLQKMFIDAYWNAFKKGWPI
ncbi:MAG: hypothetical protein WC773_03875 [Patescibacteria group bacterium]